MPRRVEFFQGVHSILTVKVNKDLTVASEIVVGVETRNKLVQKTLTAGDIDNVTRDSFDVTFIPSDFENVVPGEYEMQGKATIAGITAQLEFLRDVHVLDSIFVDTAQC